MLFEWQGDLWTRSNSIVLGRGITRRQKYVSREARAVVCMFVLRFCTLFSLGNKARANVKLSIRSGPGGWRWWCYVCCYVATPTFIVRNPKWRRFSTLSPDFSSTFPIRTLISTNKIALKSTTDGQSMFSGLFQQLIDYQNARKTQLRFCLFRQRERRFFCFPFRSFSRKAKW